jgi:hypothetical protein
MDKEGRESRRQDGTAGQLIYPKSSAIHGRVRLRVLSDRIATVIFVNDFYERLRCQFT